MNRMDGALADAGLGARMLLQVHDELVFEVPKGEQDATEAVVRRATRAATATARLRLRKHAASSH